MSHHVRIDPITWAALSRMAAANRRSVASEIAIILDVHLDMNEDDANTIKAPAMTSGATTTP